VLTTPPTSLAGIAAVLAYAGTDFMEDDETVLTSMIDSILKEEGRDFLPMIADTMKRLLAA
jgi:hypothetical protein